MAEREGWKFVTAWSLGGILASSLALGGLVFLQQDGLSGDVVTELSIEHLDGKTCRRIMQTYIERSRSGAQIVWLWAEESTPRVFGSDMRTRQVVDATKPPRPYAFNPATQAVPPASCSFRSNSLHVVSVEPSGPVAFATDRAE